VIISVANIGPGVEEKFQNASPATAHLPSLSSADNVPVIYGIEKA
jgi:hypothetical protein